ATSTAGPLARATGLRSLRQAGRTPPADRAGGPFLKPQLSFASGGGLERRARRWVGAPLTASVTFPSASSRLSGPAFPAPYWTPRRRHLFGFFAPSCPALNASMASLTACASS